MPTNNSIIWRTPPITRWHRWLDNFKPWILSCSPHNKKTKEQLTGSRNWRGIEICQVKQHLIWNFDIHNWDLNLNEQVGQANAIMVHVGADANAHIKSTQTGTRKRRDERKAGSPSCRIRQWPNVCTSHWDARGCKSEPNGEEHYVTEHQTAGDGAWFCWCKEGRYHEGTS